jgi:hypothetical protein
MNTLSIGETVSFGWEKVRKNLGFFVVLSALILGVSIGAEMVDDIPLLYLLLLVLNLILSIWVIRVGLDAVDAKKLSFSNIVPSWEIVWKFALANIVVALILAIPSLIFVGVIVALGIGSIFGGLMQAITLGLTLLFLLVILFVIFFFVLIYLSSRFMFAAYFVVDQKYEPLESLKASWRISRGVVWKLIGLSIVLGLINVAGMVALFVGLLITFPISIVALAYAYRTLAGSSKSVPSPAGDFVEPVPTPTIQK